MIRRDRTDDWLLLPQPAHAALSGVLAERWAQTSIEPRASVIAGCARHDDGWIAWEKAPEACPASGRPLDFPELALSEHLTIWQSGPAIVADDDAYAGLLVSRHGSALMESKLSAGGLDAEDARAIEDYLVDQVAFREALCARARFPTEHLGAALETNVRVLQLLDYISLIACWRKVEAPTLLRIDEGFAVELSSAPAPAGVVGLAVAPWPFGEARALEASVEAKAIPKRRYTSDTLRAALVAAAPTDLAFRFVAPA